VALAQLFETLNKAQHPKVPVVNHSALVVYEDGTNIYEA